VYFLPTHSSWNEALKFLEDEMVEFSQLPESEEHFEDLLDGKEIPSLPETAMEESDKEDEEPENKEKQQVIELGQMKQHEEEGHDDNHSVIYGTEPAESVQGSNDAMSDSGISEATIADRGEDDIPQELRKAKGQSLLEIIDVRILPYF
jgi:hypothetical protein